MPGRDTPHRQKNMGVPANIPFPVGVSSGRPSFPVALDRGSVAIMKQGYISEMFVSFQGEGALVGRRHLFLRLSGCNLRCRYCDTPGSLVREDAFTVHGAAGSFRRPNPVDRNEVLKWAGQLCGESGGVDGVALTGGEPLLQAEFLAELLRDESLPRPRLLETSGMLPDRLLLVREHVDVVSMDMKLPSNTGEPAFWAEHEDFLRACEGRAYVKILVDDTTASGELERALLIVREVAPATPIFLQPVSGGDRLVEIGSTRLAQLFTLAKNHVSDVRVLPQAHRMIGIR